MKLWSDLTQDEKDQIVSDIKLNNNDTIAEKIITDIQRELACSYCWMSWYNCLCSHDDD